MLKLIKVIFIAVLCVCCRNAVLHQTRISFCEMSHLQGRTSLMARLKSIVSGMI